MSEHSAVIEWSRGGAPFTPDDYPRDHTWRFEGGSTLNASAAPDYKGNADHANPEEAFVAALSSCHMLTFLALACKAKCEVDRYVDRAVGTLGKGDDGRMAMTRVTLRPEISFAGTAPDAETLETLHEKAHKYCFIANSVRTEVVVEHAAAVS